MSIPPIRQNSSAYLLLFAISLRSCILFIKAYREEDHSAGVSPHMTDGEQVFNINAVGASSIDEGFAFVMGAGSAILNVSSMSALYAPCRPGTQADLQARTRRCGCMQRAAAQKHGSQRAEDRHGLHRLQEFRNLISLPHGSQMRIKDILVVPFLQAPSTRPWARTRTWNPLPSQFPHSTL